MIASVSLKFPLIQETDACCRCLLNGSAVVLWNLFKQAEEPIPTVMESGLCSWLNEIL